MYDKILRDIFENVETRATSRIARATIHNDPGARCRDRGPTGLLFGPRRNAAVAPSFSSSSQGEN